MTPRLSQSSYHAHGGNVTATKHEIEQPRKQLGYKDNMSRPDPGNWLSGKRQPYFPLFNLNQSLHLLN